MAQKVHGAIIKKDSYFFERLVDEVETGNEMFDYGVIIFNKLNINDTPSNSRVYGNISEKDVGTAIRYLAQDKGFKLPQKQSDMLNALNDYHSTLSERGFEYPEYNELNFLQMEIVEILKHHYDGKSDTLCDVINFNKTAPSFFPEKKGVDLGYWMHGDAGH